jgi:hypothetical protein
MKVLVCGGRGYQDWQTVGSQLDALKPALVIHGGATGADSLAGKWAEQHGVPCRVEFADWSTHGRAAGPIRNQKMLDEYAPDLVLAFPGGRGTEDMKRRARAKGVPVKEIL